MLTLHLVRHGETDWNAEGRVQGQSESSLTDRGLQQAEQRRASIERIGPSVLYCSPSVRTMQTATVLNENLQLPVNELDDLREIMLGSWEGHLWEDLAQKHPQQVADFRSQPGQFAIDGAETFADLRDRGIRALEKIIEEVSAEHNTKRASKNSDTQTDDTQADDTHVLVVSHGAIIKAIICGYTKTSLARLWEPPRLDNCSHSEIRVVGASRHVTRIAGQDIADTDWAR